MYIVWVCGDMGWFVYKFETFAEAENFYNIVNKCGIIAEPFTKEYIN